MFSIVPSRCLFVYFEQFAVLFLCIIYNSFLFAFYFFKIAYDFLAMRLIQCITFSVLHFFTEILKKKRKHRQSLFKEMGNRKKTKDFSSAYTRYTSIVHRNLCLCGTNESCLIRYTLYVPQQKRYIGFKFLLSRSTIQAIRFSRPASVLASKYAFV